MVGFDFPAYVVKLLIAISTDPMKNIFCLSQYGWYNESFLDVMQSVLINRKALGYLRDHPEELLNIKWEMHFDFIRTVFLTQHHDVTI